MNLVDLQDAYEHGESMFAKHRFRVMIYTHRDGLYINIHGPAGESSMIMPWHECHAAENNIVIQAIDEQIALLQNSRK